MGVVNVPRLLANGAHNEVEQWVQAAEGIVSPNTSERAPYIGNLAVSPRQRRRGLGAQLMRGCSLRAARVALHSCVAACRGEEHGCETTLRTAAFRVRGTEADVVPAYRPRYTSISSLRHSARGEAGVADDLVTNDTGGDGRVDDEGVYMCLKAWEDARVGGKPVGGLEYLRYC